MALTRTSYVGLMLAAMNLTQSRFGVTDEALAEGKVSQLSIPFQNLVALFTTLSRLRRSS